ncbi:MAG: hypothetical protein P4L53_12950 [Candidatus Obscuribacterales bacterium]|nr:hypothetical protein [Candidatus Obscuribacterales bacterium]
MLFREMTPKYRLVTTQELETDRLEEQTCRPVVEGQREASTHEVVTLACFADQFDQPVGQFTYSDLNSWNRSAEFRYLVSPLFRKGGFGTKMVLAGISHMFSTLNWLGSAELLP